MPDVARMSVPDVARMSVSCSVVKEAASHTRQCLTLHACQCHATVVSAHDREDTHTVVNFIGEDTHIAVYVCPHL